MEFGLHVCQVRHPAAAYRTIIISIGIRIDVDAHKLTADYTFQHLLQFRVLVGKLYVRPHLCTGIT
jgi:hypothetical protein